MSTSSPQPSSPSEPSSNGIVAVVLANDFEDSEYTEPRDALIEAGYDLDIIGSERATVTGKNGTEVEVGHVAADVDSEQYIGLLIPGGFSPDHLRENSDVVDLVADLVERDLPTAAICHAPSLLIEAKVVHGRRMTSYQSIRTDLRNAGAEVVDAEVITDGNLITSRNPGDLPAFIEAFLGALRSAASLSRGLAATPDALGENPEG